MNNEIDNCHILNKLDCNNTYFFVSILLLSLNCMARLSCIPIHGLNDMPRIKCNKSNQSFGAPTGFVGQKYEWKMNGFK